MRRLRAAGVLLLRLLLLLHSAPRRSAAQSNATSTREPVTCFSHENCGMNDVLDVVCDETTGLCRTCRSDNECRKVYGFEGDERVRCANTYSDTDLRCEGDADPGVFMLIIAAMYLVPMVVVVCAGARRCCCCAKEYRTGSPCFKYFGGDNPQTLPRELQRVRSQLVEDFEITIGCDRIKLSKGAIINWRYTPSKTTYFGHLDSETVEHIERVRRRLIGGCVYIFFGLVCFVVVFSAALMIPVLTSYPIAFWWPNVLYAVVAGLIASGAANSYLFSLLSMPQLLLALAKRDARRHNIQGEWFACDNDAQIMSLKCCNCDDSASDPPESRLLLLFYPFDAMDGDNADSGDSATARGTSRRRRGRRAAARGSGSLSSRSSSVGRSRSGSGSGSARSEEDSVMKEKRAALDAFKQAAAPPRQRRASRRTGAEKTKKATSRRTKPKTAQGKWTAHEETIELKPEQQKCSECGERFNFNDDEERVMEGNRVYHGTCYEWPKCHVCSKVVRDEIVVAMGHNWHRECLGCHGCGKPFRDSFISKKKKAYCSVQCSERALKSDDGGGGGGEGKRMKSKKQT